MRGPGSRVQGPAMACGVGLPCTLYPVPAMACGVGRIGRAAASMKEAAYICMHTCMCMDVCMYICMHVLLT